MAPRLQAEFGMSYGLAGLHQSAFAAGMVLLGLAGGALIRRLGFLASAWGGVAGMLLGLLGMTLATGPAGTLGSIFIMSLAGTTALSAAQAAFAEWPAEQRGRLVLESNMAASAFMMLVPLTLLAGDALGTGWRFVLPAMLAASAVAAMVGLPPALRRRAAERRAGAEARASAAPLGPSFWRAWLIVFLGVSVEWALSFWCMTYLLGLPGADTALASAGVVVLGLSAVAGRFASSLVAHRVRETTLVVIATCAVLAGFPLYWLRPGVGLTFLGLAVCGLGSSNYYPLGLTLALGRAPGASARAASLVPVASGSAIALAPFLLGRLADATDMRTALWYVPIGSAAILATVAFDRLRERRASPS